MIVATSILLLGTRAHFQLLLGGPLKTSQESKTCLMLNDEVDSTNCRVSVDCRSSSKQAEQKQLKLVNA